MLDNPSMKISDLKQGETAEIIGFIGRDRAYRHKLLAMGLTPGVYISLLRVAPLGDPIEIRVREYSLSLRKEEAAILQIKSVVGDENDKNMSVRQS